MRCEAERSGVERSVNFLSAQGSVHVSGRFPTKRVLFVEVHMFSRRHFLSTTSKIVSIGVVLFPNPESQFSGHWNRFKK